MPDRKRLPRSFRAVEGDWRRVDIHLHTPASADWAEPNTTYLEWLQKAESRGLDIIAITDHNTVEGVARLRAEIERLAWLEANDRLRSQERRELDEYRRLGDKILVLPGFEFTATFGFHILAIFPPETPLRKLELLLLRLGVPMERITDGSTEVGPTTDVLTAYRLIREAGGLVIAAHANSTHGVALQGMSFGGQTRIAFTQDSNLHALEVNDLESTSRRATARFFDGSKPEYPRRMHCIQGSDAHRLSRDPKDKNRLGVGERVTEMLLPEVSFEALRALLEGSDFTRTRPYRPPAEAPFDHVEAAREQGPNIVQAFHESLSREGGRLHKILCDVVAFANTRGGTVYVGVSAARKTPPKGIENPEATITLLRKEIERNVAPPIESTVDVLQSQGVPVIRIGVPDGADKPYVMNQTRIYIRQEGETNEAVRDEIVQLVLASRQAAAAEAAAGAAGPSQPAASAAESGAAALPGEAVSAPTPVETLAEAQPAGDGLPAPAIGVEIVAMEERKGSRHFTIRDLRNGNTIQNVTLHSARKLWSYAINQYLTSPVDPARVQWDDDLGVVQVARRAKRLRYDLAMRLPDGRIRVFYGVTADGMSGPWARFLQAEDRNGGSTHAAVVTPVIDEYEAEEEGEPMVTTFAPEDATYIETLPEYTEAEAPEPPSVPEPVATQPEPEPEAAPKRRAARTRSKKAQPAADAAAEEPALPAEALEALAAPQPAEPKPVEPADDAPVADAPKPRVRRSRAAAKPAVEAAQPDGADASAPTGDAPAAEEKPKRRTRTRKVEPAPAEPQSAVSEAAQPDGADAGAPAGDASAAKDAAAEEKPKRRTRTRKTEAAPAEPAA